MGLREFIERLQVDNDYYKFPKTVQIDPEYQMAALIREVCNKEGPAVEAYSPIGISMVGGLYGSKKRIKRILAPEYFDVYCGVSDLDAVKRYVKCSDVTSKDSLWDHCILDSSKTPPCQEVVLKGNDVDLSKLPICTHNELDKGPFITAGVNVVPWIHNSEIMGLGIHRMNVVNDNTLSCLAPINRRVGFPHYKSKDGIKMAVCIGAPPVVVLASQAKLPQDAQKYIVASQLHQKKIKLARCKTSNILVPSSCELVLECTSVPNSQWDDTPFAEYPGTYSFRSNAWICKVDAITHRKDFKYQTILTGKVPQEDSNLCAIPYAAEVYRVASRLVEEVTDIAAFIGNNVFDTIICIKKNSNSEVENLIYQLLGNKYLKSVTVMDHDLEANQDDWRFAFNTRYQPNRDTVITNMALGASLDPSSPLFQSTSKIGLDFTIPIGKNDMETEVNWKRHRVATTHPMITVQENFWEK